MIEWREQARLMEDERMLRIARAQGAHGAETARIYANILQRRALEAFDELRLDEALDLAEREFEFCSRAFGLTHEFSRAAHRCLSALRRQSRTKLLEMQAALDVCLMV